MHHFSNYFWVEFPGFKNVFKPFCALFKINVYFNVTILYHRWHTRSDIKIFEIPYFSYLILQMGKIGHFKKIWTYEIWAFKKAINPKTAKEPKLQFFHFEAFQNKMQMPTHDRIIFHMLFEVCYISSRMHSVKPFKSKNRDKIDLDASNPNLKKADQILFELFRTFNLKTP